MFGASCSIIHNPFVSASNNCFLHPTEVNNPPAAPSVLLGPISGSSGTYYTYATKTTDPDGDQVKYSFDWGDGTISTTSLVSSGAEVRLFHKWTVISGLTKTFSVLVKATDEHGMASSWSSPLSVTITGPGAVNNPPASPSVPSGSTSGASGTSYSYSTKATDPDGDQVKYTFDWGDGTSICHIPGQLGHSSERVPYLDGCFWIDKDIQRPRQGHR